MDPNDTMENTVLDENKKGEFVMISGRSKVVIGKGVALLSTYACLEYQDCHYESTRSSPGLQILQ